MTINNLEFCPSKVKHHELLKHTDEMTNLYLNHNMTLQEIGQKFNCDKKAISNILQKNDVEIIKANHRKKTLICIDCKNEFIGRKGSALRCSDCRKAKNSKLAKERYRRKAGVVVCENICIQCHEQLTTTRVNRRYCDKCRIERSSELKRQRRAKNPEKYRQKDKQYNDKSYAGHISATNRRAKKYGKSILKVNLIRSIFDRDNFTCQYCCKRGGDLTIDHIIPLCRGGENDEINLVTSCRLCNLSKNKKTLLQFLLFMNARERN